jgi:hypothetical protein
MASLKGHTEVVKILVGHGANVNTLGMHLGLTSRAPQFKLMDGR